MTNLALVLLLLFIATLTWHSYDMMVIDSGSEGELSDGEVDDGRRGRKKGAVDETAALQAEIDQMSEQLSNANIARATAEAKAKQAEQRVEHLQQMAKSAKAVLAKQYGTRVALISSLLLPSDMISCNRYSHNE
jgi:hypothetical protein